MSTAPFFPKETLLIEKHNEFELPNAHDVVELKIKFYLRILVGIIAIATLVVSYIAFNQGNQKKGWIYLLFLGFVGYISYKKKIFGKDSLLVLSDKGMEYQNEFFPWSSVTSMEVVKKRRKLRTYYVLYVTTREKNFKIGISSLNKSTKEILHLIHCFKNKEYRN